MRKLPLKIKKIIQTMMDCGLKNKKRIFVFLSSNPLMKERKTIKTIKDEIQIIIKSGMYKKIKK